MDRIIHRGRYGMAPLLYASSGDDFVTGSSYEEIFASGLVEKVWRPEAVVDFLSSGTVAFPEGKTFFEGVFQVPPGCSLHISKDKKLSIETGVSFPEASGELGEESLPLLRERLTGSFKTNLNGAALSLSGGLDSTTLAAAWARVGKPLCFIYGVPQSSDRELALETVKALGLDYRLLEPENTATIGEIKTMLKALEIPVHIPGGPLPQFRLLSAMAKSGVKKVISGQAGDELLCGYPWYFPLAMNRLMTIDPDRVSRYESLHEANPPFGPLDLRLSRRCFTRTSSWVTLNDGGASSVLGMSREDIAQRKGVKFFAPDLENWEELRRHELCVRTLPYLLHYDHHLTDYFGLSSCSPFLDKGVVDLVSRFSIEFLYKDGFLKYPLRKLFEEVPEKVRYFTKKRGFWHSSPRLPDLNGEVHRMVQCEELKNFTVNPEFINKMKPSALWRFFALGTLMETD